MFREILLQKAIEVKDGGRSVSFEGRATLQVSELLARFNGERVYATNNSTLGIVFEGAYYAAPYTRELINLLEEECFRRKEFFVAFSNGDRPYDPVAAEKWQHLRDEARESYKKDFISDCEEWCDEHHIEALPDEDEILKRCFKIPNTPWGVRALSSHGGDVIVRPVITTSFMDAIAVSYLGKFAKNNGKVVFVYRDGATYVAKGYGIIQLLLDAGFREDHFFVPFSNSEEIIDKEQKWQWENLPKF